MCWISGTVAPMRLPPVKRAFGIQLKFSAYFKAQCELVHTPRKFISVPQPIREPFLNLNLHDLATFSKNFMALS